MVPTYIINRWKFRVTISIQLVPTEDYLGYLNSSIMQTIIEIYWVECQEKHHIYGNTLLKKKSQKRGGCLGRRRSSMGGVGGHPKFHIHASNMGLWGCFIRNFKKGIRKYLEPCFFNARPKRQNPILFDYLL